MKNCNVADNIEIKPYSTLRAIQEHFGTNVTEALTAIRNVVAQSDESNIVPTEHFKQWYDKRYKTPLNFNAGEGIRLKDIILKYINEQKVDVASTARNTNDTDAMTKFGYTTMSAKVQGKRYVTSSIIKIDNLLNNVKKFVNPQSYEYHQVNKAKIVIKHLIDDSKLDETTKKSLIESANNCTTLAECKRLVTENNLSNTININEANE